MKTYIGLYENCCCTGSCPAHREGTWQRTGATSSSRHYMVLNEQFHAPAALLPEKEPPVPLNSRLGGSRVDLDDLGKR